MEKQRSIDLIFRSDRFLVEHNGQSISCAHCDLMKIRNGLVYSPYIIKRWKGLFVLALKVCNVVILPEQQCRGRFSVTSAATGFLEIRFRIIRKIEVCDDT